MTRILTLEEAFGLALRQMRERRRLSQEALADLAGVHRTYVGSVERGERNISLRNIEALARALGQSASMVLKVAEGLRESPSSTGEHG